MIDRNMINKKTIIIIGMILLAAGVTYAAYAAGIVLFGGNSYQDINDGLVLDIDLTQDNYTAGSKTFTDASGSGNNGVSANAATFTTDNYGQSTGAMNFNGTGDYIDTGGAASLNTGNQITVSAWIKPTHWGNTYWDGIVGKSNDSLHGYVLAKLSTSDALAFSIRSGYQASFSPLPPVNVWTHIVGTYDGANIKIYQDGIEKNSTPYIGTVETNGSTLAIGRLYSWWNEAYFKGSISEVKIWNRALSLAEVETLYESSKPKMSAGSTESGLIGHWPLDGAGYNSTTNRVTDKTPYENHGLNYGATLTTDRMGQSNGAMSFNGSDYIDCGSNVLFNSSKPVTVSFWTKLTGYSVSYPVILRLKTDQSTGFILFYSAITSYTGINFGSNTNFVRLKTAGNISASLIGVWKNVVMVYDGVSRTANSSYKLYIDGVEQSLVGSAAFAVVPQVNTISNPVSGNPFPGSIADIRIYNRALSQDEIGALYSSYKPKAAADSLQKGLVLDMPLTSSWTKSETAGSEIMTDRTPYSNNGQNYGATVGSDYASFNGVDNYIDLGDDTFDSLSEGTISAWIKLNSLTGTNAISVSKKSSSADLISLQVRNCAGGVCPGFWCKANGVASFGGSANILLSTDNWYFMAMTVSASGNKLYLNGQNQAVTYSAGNSSSNAFFDDLSSGAQIYSIGAAFLSSAVPVGVTNGSIADVRIYNRALSDSEIKSLYDKGK